MESQKPTPHWNAEAWLSDSSLFRTLSSHHINHLASHATEQRLEDREALFWSCEIIDFVALIIDGNIYYTLHGPDGKELIIGQRRPGELIGELAMIGQYQQYATAYAAGITRVLMIKKKHLLELLNDALFLQQITSLLASRMLEASAFIETTCLHSLDVRLARYLVGNTIRDGRPRVRLPANQSIIASMLNASRPKLNAKLQSWRKQGLIRMNRSHILIDNLVQVSQKAQRF